MSAKALRSAQQIKLRIIVREIEEGIAGALQTKEELSLADLINRYLTHLGFESAFTSSIIVQLLINGKVRVDFSKVAERLELLCADDCMTATQAMTLFEEHVASMRTGNEAADKSRTVRIILQKPRD